MALIYCDASEDLPEKSAGRAALSSMDLVDMVGGGAEGCCDEGWVGDTGGVIKGWLDGARVLWVRLGGAMDAGPTGGAL